MRTRHQLFFQDSRQMQPVKDRSVHLVVTSPPYPMIAMWDDVFAGMDPRTKAAIRSDDGNRAFELMHRCLDPVWKELWRIMVDGAIACINIGDATRKVGTDFSLFANHARILSQLLNIGFTPLPAILWRKPTNSPTKFMGSGMLPAGAYVTLEHEYILVVRKGSRRKFNTDREKQLRRESAIFWEERNDWYSDIWLNLIGADQRLNSRTARHRSAAFPFEIPYRLINMFSVKGDRVVDPFAGTGTTLKACAVAGRNSFGFEIDAGLRDAILSEIGSLPAQSDLILRERVQRHRAFIETCKTTTRSLNYKNSPYQLPVVTRQETDLFFNPIASVRMMGENELEVTYKTP